MLVKNLIEGLNSKLCKNVEGNRFDVSFLCCNINNISLTCCDSLHKIMYCHFSKNIMSIIVHVSLWSWLKENCHDGAFGNEGEGYRGIVIDDDFYVLITKIPIDVENICGYYWDKHKGTFNSVLDSFRVPFEIFVNVGDYTLLPYKKPDDYGKTDELFTKWRIQLNEDLFGVHYISNGCENYAFIPSVVIQMSCPNGDIPRHLEDDRYTEENKWAEEFVSDLRKLSMHARDVHSQHHGIVVLNKTPSQFSDALKTVDMEKIAKKYKMEKWAQSYYSTFTSIVV